MLAASSSWLRVGLAVLMVGGAIKLLDDMVDRELDLIIGKKNLLNTMGDGLVVYMAAAIAIAVYLSPATGATLFLAAYLVGMGNELGALYLAGWRAWVEVVAAALIGCFIDPRQFVLNLILIAAVQLTDDFHDLKQDQLAGRRTLPARLGPAVSLLMILSLVLTALILSPGYSLWVMACAWMITTIAERTGS